MILASDIIVDLKAALDAEGSDYYTEAQDYIPAINRAMDYIVTVFNKAFAENKLSEENLRELIQIKLYQLSSTSSLTFDAQELATIWSVYALYPKPRTTPASITPLTPSTESQEIANATFLGGDKSTKRRTLEDWNDTEGNPFESGNSIVTTGDLVEYAHLSFASQAVTYIQIRPDIPNAVCAVAFLNYPTHVEDAADGIPFPAVLRNMVTSRALHYIATKQGDNTTAMSISDRETMELINLLT